MATIKTWKLERNILAGDKSFTAGSTHVEGRMVPEIETEFKENKHYFKHISTIEEEPEEVELVTEDKPKPKRMKKIKKKTIKE